MCCREARYLGFIDGAIPIRVGFVIPSLLLTLSYQNVLGYDPIVYEAESGKDF